MTTIPPKPSAFAVSTTNPKIVQTLTRYYDTSKIFSSDTTNVDYANHKRSNIYIMDPVEASTEYDKYNNRLYGMCERRIYLYFRGFSAVNLGYNRGGGRHV